MTAELTGAKDRLATDLKNVVHDAEALMREVGHELSEKGKQARARLSETLKSAKGTCQQIQGKTVATAKAADRCVHENPMTAVGAAFGAGLILGLLLWHD